MRRPPHITVADWQRMSWHARQRAAHRAGLYIVPTHQETLVRQTPANKRQPKVRVYRVAPGCWEITNGISTARTATAQAAWRLFQHLGRTA
jgi:hypothetical protein